MTFDNLQGFLYGNPSNRRSHQDTGNGLWVSLTITKVPLLFLSLIIPWRAGLGLLVFQTRLEHEHPWGRRHYILHGDLQRQAFNRGRQGENRGRQDRWFFSLLVGIGEY